MDQNLQDAIDSAETGNVRAMVYAAGYIVWKDQTKPVDPEFLNLAKTYYRKAASLGSSAAMVDIGAMYYMGRGEEQDYSQAFFWYKKAAALGNIHAISNLGYSYYYGRDIPVDYEKAYQMFSQAAFLGDLTALYRVGDMFMKGNFVDKSEFTAFIIYQKCLNEIHENPDLEIYPAVCIRLGECYGEGKGTEKDLSTAEEFLDHAIEYLQLDIKAGGAYGKIRMERAEKSLQKVRLAIEDEKNSGKENL